MRKGVKKHTLCLHRDGFQRVVIDGARLHLLFKPEAVVGLVTEVEVVIVVLRGINDDHALRGERNVDVEHADCETHYECWQRNVIEYKHGQCEMWYS